MPFQVVELRLDAEDQVIDRRAIPYPYPQRLDAVDTIKNLTARLDKAHYEAERDFLVGCRQRRENAAQICHRRRLTMFGSKQRKRVIATRPPRERGAQNDNQAEKQDRIHA
jgi:hypothetical protein